MHNSQKELEKKVDQHMGLLQAELTSTAARVTKMEEASLIAAAAQMNLAAKQSATYLRMTKLEQDLTSVKMTSAAATSVTMSSTQGSETKDPIIVEVRGWKRDTERTKIVEELRNAIGGSGATWTDAYAPFLFGAVGVIRCSNGPEAETMIQLFRTS